LKRHHGSAEQPTTAQRRREAQRAEEELDRLGI
jgi:hypothetical protein